MRRISLNIAKLGFIILVFPPLFVQAETCSPNGYTVLTLNGVFTDEGAARNNKRTLERRLDIDFNGEPLTIDYVHNPSHLAGIGDILKAAYQGLFDSETVTDYDLVEMIRSASEKVKTQKLLLVAHSQGNFYANSFYDSVIARTDADQTRTDADSPEQISDGNLHGQGSENSSEAQIVRKVSKDSIAVYSVATPAGRVAGGGKWLTSDTDKVIAGVVGRVLSRPIMSPNTHVELSASDESFGHGFSDIYLKYKGAEIVSDIRESLSKLKSDSSRASGPCIPEPKIGAVHKISGVAFKVADPLANATRIVATGAVKGVNTVGLAVIDAGKFAAQKIASLFNREDQFASVASAVTAENSSETQSGSVPTVENPIQIEPDIATESSSRSGQDAVVEETVPDVVIASPNLEVPIPIPMPSPAPAPVRLSPPGGGGGGVTNPPQPSSTMPAVTTAQATEQTTTVISTETASTTTNTATTTTDASTNSEPSAPADTTSPSAPVVTFPTENSVLNYSGIVFQGTAEASSTISTDFSTATSSTDNLGTWTLSLSLPQGVSTINFNATDSAGNISSSTAITLTVDSESPSVSLSSDTCSNSLSDNSCLVTATTLSFAWNSTSNDLSYFTIDSNGAVSTTTATSTIVTATDNSDYSFSVSAVDTAGNISATSTITVSVSTMPVVINEIAWAGTGASANDEWIELYNNSGKDISLENFVLYSVDLSPYLRLSGTIGARSYFLIERTDDDTVSDISADLVLPFSGEGGSGLNNNGESLDLVHVPAGSSTTTIDSVAVCSGNGGTTWCKGSSANKTSMERYDPAVSGGLQSNWETHLGEFIMNGKDGNNSAIKGTPKSRNSVSHLVALNGSLSGDKSLSVSNSPYLVGRSGLTVPEGMTLTLGPGTVVKIVSNNEPQIDIKGKIVAEGTSENPVVFTSFYDDAYGGDLNADSTATTPGAGDWRRILINSTSAGSSLGHTLVRYAGNVNSSDTAFKKGAIGVDSTTVSLSNVTIEDSRAHGLALVNSQSTISDSRFISNDYASLSSAGIYISGGSPSVSNSSFESNYRGIRIESATPVVSQNTFTNQIESAVSTVGSLGTFEGNSGSGNGTNAIVLAGSQANAGTTTLKSNPLPYLLKGRSTVPSGSTLEIESGVVVKGYINNAGNVGWLEVANEGEILSSGTSPSDILFTSVRDVTSEAGGSTESVASGNPEPGDWVGISVLSGGKINLSGFTIKYAGQGAHNGPPMNASNFGALQIVGFASSSGSIVNAVFEKNYQSGLNLKNVGGLSVSNSTFNDHTQKRTSHASGIYSNSSTAEFSGLTFSGNSYDAFGIGTNNLTCSDCGTPNVTPSNLFTQ